MANSITNRQMFFLIFLTLTSYTTIELPSAMVQTAGRSSWIPIMAAAMIYALTAVVITKLNNMFRGKVLFDYSREITGKLFAYVIVFYNFFVSLLVGIFLNVKLINLLKSNFLPETPRFVLLFIGILLFGYVAYKGVTNIARMFEIIGVLVLLITITLCVLMLFQGSSENILPLFEKSDAKEFLPTLKNLVVPYTGLGVLFVIPFTAKNKKPCKVAFFTLIIIGLFYVLVVESTVMILGIINAASFNDAFIEAIKMVEFPVIERTDIYYLTFGLTSLFAGNIAVYTASVEFACRLFSPLKRYIIVIAVGTIIFVGSSLGLKIASPSDVYGSFAPYLFLVSSFLIPAVLLIIAKLRKRGRANDLQT